nr:hypothetical protein [Nostoc sp. ChiQUE02]MDZ8234391.1 hypothetical protein [Nostoc sp. ChiQUE02]
MKIGLEEKEKTTFVMEKYLVENFSFKEICLSQEVDEYIDFMEKTYQALNFPYKELYPKHDSRLIRLNFKGELAGICALNSIRGKENDYYRFVPAIRSLNRLTNLLEVSNFIIKPEYRGTIAIGLMMYECAKLSMKFGYDYLVGITRYQVLRHFVDFGVVPVDHEPLHLLNREDILDFIIYYDTHSSDSIRYMHERAKRYFHQRYVMTCIKEKYVN